ncbi:MAG: hypothetical protein L6Q76_01515 [Polyangiaceae bacterium]|nr:hypothetical protein [Polyangiaceae bacterium]
MPTRDLWHLGFARLIRQRAPPGFLVRPEVPLSDEPQRADLILIRREDVPPCDGEAQVLRALWSHLGRDTVLEFKSPVRGFRRTDLKRLVAYGAQYHVLEDERLLSPDELTLVLVVPARGASLDDEIARMGFRLTWLGGGYGRIDGGVYTVFLAVTDEVSDEERDDFLRIFSHHECQSNEAFWWWQQWRAEDVTMQDVKTIEGYEDMRRKFAESLTLEERLAGLAPEQRLAGLAPEQVLSTFSPEQVLSTFSPEQVLSTFSPEQRLLSLPDDALRALSDDYLRSLPADVQETIRKRIGRPNQ